MLLLSIFFFKYLWILKYASIFFGAKCIENGRDWKFVGYGQCLNMSTIFTWFFFSFLSPSKWHEFWYLWLGYTHILTLKLFKQSIVMFLKICSLPNVDHFGGITIGNWLTYSIFLFVFLCIKIKCHFGVFFRDFNWITKLCRKYNRIIAKS